MLFPYIKNSLFFHYFSIKRNRKEKGSLDKQAFSEKISNRCVETKKVLNFIALNDFKSKKDSLRRFRADANYSNSIVAGGLDV